MRELLAQSGRLVAVQSSDRRPIDVAFAAVVVAAAFVMTIGFAWSLDSRSDALDDRLDALDGSASSVVVRFADLVDIESRSSPFDRALGPVDEAAAAFPEPLSRILDEPEFVIDTSKFTIETIDGAEPATPSTVTIRFQSGLEEQSTLVDGRRPAEEPADAGTIEVVMSVATAVEMDVDVGDLVAVSLDLDDPLARRNRALPEPFDVVVVGIVELSAPEDSFWFGDERLHRPVVNDTPLGAERIAFVAGSSTAVGPDAPFAVSGSAPLSVERRTRTEVGLVTLGNDAAIRTSISEVEATTTRSSAIGVASVVIGMGDELDDSATERSAASDLLGFVTAGWLLVVLTALGEVNLARLRRRREQFELLARRGAMRSAVLVGAAVTAAALVTVGSAGGVAVGVAVSGIVGFSPAIGPTAAGVGVLVCSIVLATVFHATSVFRAERSELPGGLRVRRLDPQPPGWGRLAVTVQIVVVAAWSACVALFARTGLRSADLLSVSVVFGLAIVASVLTHRRTARDSRWSAVAVGAAITLSSVVVIGRSWQPATDGPIGTDLAADVAAQLLLWGATALGGAVVAVLIRGTGVVRSSRPSGLDRSTDALLTSCLAVLTGTAVVGSLATDRIDLDGVGDAVGGPGRTGFAVAAGVAAALVALAAFARRRHERRISPAPTGADT